MTDESVPNAHAAQPRELRFSIPIPIKLTGDLMQEVRIAVAQLPEMNQTVAPDHRKILERIKARDAEGARAEMSQHVEHARRLQDRVFVRPRVPDLPWHPIL